MYIHIHVPDLIYVTWLIMCDMTKSGVTEEEVCVCVCIYVNIFDTTHSYVTWLIGIRDVTHTYIWHDSFTRVTRLMDTRDMTHSHMWHDSFIRVTWLLCMYVNTFDMTHLHVTWLTCVLYDSFMCHVTHICVTWLIYTWHVSRIGPAYTWHDSFVSPTDWRRPIGCLKSQVIFRKRATYYRVLLLVTTYKDKVSYDYTPLCI